MQQSRQVLIAAFVAYLLLPIGVCVLSAADVESAVAAPVAVQQTVAATASGITAGKLILWTLGAIEVWLVGWLTLWFLLLWMKPLALKSIDAKLTGPRGEGKMTLANWTLVRPFSMHRRVIDAWIELHAGTFREWHGVAANIDSDESWPVLCERLAMNGSPESLRSMLPVGQFCIVLQGESRRWDSNALGRLLAWGLADNRDSRLATYRVLPIVLDRHCLDRALAPTSDATQSDAPTLFEDSIDDAQFGYRPDVSIETPHLLLTLIQTELSRIVSSDIVWTDRWVQELLATGRLMVVADDWARLPVVVQNLLRKEFAFDGIQSLLIVSGGAHLGVLPNSIELMSPSAVGASLGPIASLSIEIVRQSASLNGTGLRLAQTADDEGPVDAMPLLAVGASLGSIAPLTIENIRQSEPLSRTDPRLAPTADEWIVPFSPAAAVARPTARPTVSASAPADCISPPEFEDALPQLMRLLCEPHADRRSAAAVALGRIGNDARSAVSLLSQCVLDDECRVRQSAARALGQIGSSDATAVLALCKAMSDADATVRLFAAWSLGKVGQTKPLVALALKEGLRDAEPEVRCQAIRSLGELGPLAKVAIEELGQLLGDPDAQVRRAVVSAVACIDLSAVPLLTKALEDSDREVRRLAASLLSGIGLAAVPTLLGRSSNAAVGNAGSTTDAATNSVAELDELLQDTDTTVRERAVSALAGYGPTAIGPLCRALLDSSSEVRRRAAASLGRIGNGVELSIPALSQLLDDDDVEVRREVVSTLGRIGSRPELIVAALTRALSDRDAEIRGRSAAALRALNREAAPATAALALCLIDPEAGVRSRAAAAIGAIGPMAKDAVPALMTALRDNDSEVRWQAAAALGQVGIAAVPSLAKSLLDADAEVRRCAADSLDRLGAFARDAVRPLSVALRDDDVGVRRSAASALGRIGPAASEAIPALVMGLTDPDTDARRNMAVALGQLGPIASDAIPALERATNDRTEKVRAAAILSLGRIKSVQKSAA